MSQTDLPAGWPIATALENCILKPMRADPETVALLNQHGPNFDNELRQRLDRGRAPCDTPTKALWYCYSYLLMHLDAYSTMMRHRATFFGDLLLDSGPELLMIDFGCGPLTSVLAMAEFNLQCPCGVVLSYVGIDHMEPMLKKSAELASIAFEPYWRPTLVPGWDGLTLPVTPAPQKLLFNFSYFFGQLMPRAVIQSCADFVKATLVRYRLDQSYLVYLNKDDRGYQDNYHYFKHLLGIPVEPISPIEYVYRRFRRLKFGGYSRPEPSLHQEVVQLDWQKYTRG